MKTAIIGAGASGLMAACFSFKKGNEVTLYEANDRIGKKILATGNGRCNLTNMNITPYDYNHPEFVKPLLSIYPPEVLLGIYRKMGLFTRCDSEGRVYPLSDSATSVLDILRLHAEKCADIICEAKIESITEVKNGFMVKEENGKSSFYNKVIVASGGGTQLLKSMGVEYIPFSPVLCSLETDNRFTKPISGLKSKCRCTLIRGDKVITSLSGEVLFRDYGISGIVTFDLSRYAKAGDKISIDLCPEIEEHALAKLLFSRKKEHIDDDNLLTGIFHRRVAENLIKYAGSSEPAKLSHAAKNFTVTVKGCGDRKSAQVTRGGADIREFNPATLEHRRIKGLYCTGEALDIDGKCGGYNLHWAFISGIGAIKSALN